MEYENIRATPDLKANMVIVGGGGAGIAAASAAAESGMKNIMVLEKRSQVGGNSAIASGIFGAESPAQKRQAILAPKEELFRRMMYWSNLRANPRIVRAFIDKSDDTIAWLENMGIFFQCLPHSPTDNPRTWHVPKGQGAEILQALTRECAGLGVEMITDTTARKLLKDTQGRISGVIAEQNGRTISVQAPGVVISSGGFAGDRELMRRYCPDYRDEMGLAGISNTGEGIFMTLEAGAAQDGLGYVMAAGPLAGGSMLRLGADNVPVRIGFISGEPFSLWVNQQGRRFIAETESFNYYRCINALTRQPGAVAYALLDTDMIQSISEHGLTNVAEGYGFGPDQRRPLPGLAKALQAEAENGSLKVSSDWNDIARGIGVDPDALRCTIEEYNAGCDRGYDSVFAKIRPYLWPLRQPPFYALTCRSAILNTIGGIKVNEHMEVLDKQDLPIPGLYAAGVDTGGWTGDTYCADLPGTAFGYAVNSGRIAGENVARYLRSE
jgi:fumarate reductase flavoprotein subunit